MTNIWTNNATTTLDSGIDAVTTTVNLATGTGAYFPSPSGAEFFWITIGDGTLLSELEICQVTARAGDVLTVVRAQQLTTGKAFDSGVKVELRLTRTDLEGFIKADGTVPLTADWDVGDFEIQDVKRLVETTSTVNTSLDLTRGIRLESDATLDPFTDDNGHPPAIIFHGRSDFFFSGTLTNDVAIQMESVSGNVGRLRFHGRHESGAWIEGLQISFTDSDRATAAFNPGRVFDEDSVSYGLGFFGIDVGFYAQSVAFVETFGLSVVGRRVFEIEADQSGAPGDETFHARYRSANTGTTAEWADGIQTFAILDATVGTPENISPMFKHMAKAWNTTATASELVEFGQWAVPQSAATPTGYWTLQSRINEGAAVENLRVTNAGAITAFGELAMSANKITGVADPTLAQDAATKAYVDAAAPSLTPWTENIDAAGFNLTDVGKQAIGVDTVDANAILRLRESEATGAAATAAGDVLVVERSGGAMINIVTDTGATGLAFSETGYNRRAGYFFSTNSPEQLYISLVGAPVFRLDATGIGINGHPQDLFHVITSGNADALRIDDTTANAAFGQVPDANATLAVVKSAVLNTDSQVTDVLLLENNDHCYLHINSSATKQGGLIFADTVWGVGYVAYDHSDDSMRFGANSSEGMRILSDGAITASPDADQSFTFGRALIDSRTTDWAHFSHVDHTSTTSFALQQRDDGRTLVGSAAGTSTNLYIGGAARVRVTSTGTAISDGALPSDWFHVYAAGEADAFRIDDTTGDIGIGQAPSGAALAITRGGTRTMSVDTYGILAGPTGNTFPLLRPVNSGCTHTFYGDEDTGLSHAATNELGLYAGGEQARLTATGLHLNGTSPDIDLHIGDAASLFAYETSAAGIIAATSSSIGRLALQGADQADVTLTDSSGAVDQKCARLAVSDGEIRLEALDDDGTVNTNDIMYYDLSNSRLGFGTDIPAVALHFNQTSVRFGPGNIHFLNSQIGFTSSQNPTINGYQANVSLRTNRSWIIDNYLGIASGVITADRRIDCHATGGSNAFQMADATARVSFGDVPGAAHMVVRQDGSADAVPVLLLQQDDVSEEFIRFIGTSTTDASQSLVDAVDLTTPGTLTGWLKIYVQDDQGTNPIADGVYYMPFYTAPTA